MSELFYDEDESSSFKVKMLIGGLVVGLVILSGVAGYFYWQTKNLALTAPSAKAETESDYVAKIGSLIILPKDEQVVVLVVKDESQYKGQVILDQAKNGDVILVYQKAGKVIIYRPQINKIVESAVMQPGQLSLNQSSPSSAQK